MRSLYIIIGVIAILSITTTALASGWSMVNLGTNAKPVITYSISTGAYRGDITIVNYTALMLQSIRYNMEHRIPLNQTQLEFLAFLQALSTQPTSMPSIVNVTIVSTGAQPLGPYASYEVFLINATLSSPAPTLLFYEVPTYWLGIQQPLFLVALPGTRFALAYEVLWESSSACIAVFGHYESPMGLIGPLDLPLYETVKGGYVVNYQSCTNTAIYYGPVSLTVNINGVNYTQSFEPYEGASTPNPPFPNTIVLNTTANPGSIGIYDVPFATPLFSCSGTFATSCTPSDTYTPPPGYTPVVWSKYLSPTIYENMPAILVYPTQPGLYAYPNEFALPFGATPSERFLVVYANVTGPSVVPKELFSISQPYGACFYSLISPSPLQLTGVANYGFLAQISGWAFMSNSVWASFYGWAAGVNTSEPGFVSAVLGACDNRGFWALTPVTLNITLTDEYGYPVGYGLVSFGPNYYAWLAIVLAISAIGSGAYILVTKLRGGRGEVVVRL